MKKTSPDTSSRESSPESAKDLDEHCQNSVGARAKEITLYFFRLGITGFGGPLALVAQMERELTQKRWISAQEFAQAFTAIKTMPGPLAFQTAVFMGQRRGKTLGAAIAAVMLILPSALLMMLLASSRSSWSHWSWTQDISLGFQAAALGLIAASAFQLARSAGKGRAFWIFAALGFACTARFPSLEPVVVIASGLIALTPDPRTLIAAPSAILGAIGGSTPLSAALVGVSSSSLLSDIGWTCFKAGALVFGSGLAIVPVLGSEFVDHLHWLTQTEFLEALMFGQITPGPIVITATYVGYRVSGVSGATVATLAIFAAPFFHMTTWFPRMWERISKSLWWSDFSRGAISCVVGSIAASVVKLAEPIWLEAFEAVASGPFKVQSTSNHQSALSTVLWLTLSTGSFWMTIKKKTPSWRLILAGGVISYIVFLLSQLAAQKLAI